jgi:GxxExxY protein
MLNDAVDRLAERIIGCAIEVHRTMGPGLLESVYRECLLMEMTMQELDAECDRVIAVDYKGRPLKARFKIDLLVNNSIIIELKAVEGLRPVHSAQIMTYLRLTGCPAGLLMNFNEVTLRGGLKRLDHPTRYAAAKQLRPPRPDTNE